MMFEEELNSNIYQAERIELYQEQYEEWVRLMEMDFTDVVILEDEEYTF